mgnify:CR=1 FL=1
MSTVIDSRTVEMRFDNQQFEKNVQTSIGTLDKLKQALNFSKFEDVGSKINFGAVSDAVATAGEKFSAFEAIAMGALMRIGAQAVDLGEKLVKSLSIDQISAGWEKYGEMTSNVATIMAATGLDVEAVSGQMEKLLYFTDETSYNFTDMANNIGKFTANDVPLENAMGAMEGIATWAARSGQNAGTASRVMYNLAQAIGMGSLKLQDWKSVELANMGTKEFKEMAIQAGLASGTLKKVGDQIVTTGKNTAVTVSNFRETLAEGWLDTQTLVGEKGVLTEYGKAAELISQIHDQTGLWAKDMVELVDLQKEGKLTTKEMAEALDISEEELKGNAELSEYLSQSIEKLASDEYKFSLETYKAAQEARTFRDAIDATKDAVSSGWMKTFELLFGKYDQAKTLWSGVAEGLYDIFTHGTEARNSLLKIWADYGGQQKLADGIINSLTNIKQLLDLVKDRWANFFGELNAGTLLNITQRFKEFTEAFRLYVGDSKELTPAGEKLKTVLDTVFGLGKSVGRVLQNVGRIVKDFLSSLSPAVNAVGRFGKNVIELFTSGFNRVGDFLETVHLTELFGNVSATAAEAINFFAGKIEELRLKFEQWQPGEGLKAIGDRLKGVGTVIADFFKTTDDGVTPFQKITNAISNFIGKIGNLKGVLEPVKQFFSGLWTGIKNALDLNGVTNVFEGIAKLFSNIIATLRKMLSNFSFGDALKVAAGYIGVQALKLAKVIPNLGNNIGEVLKAVSEFVSGFKEKGLLGGSLFGDSGGLLGMLFPQGGSTITKTIESVSRSLLMLGAGLALVTASLVVLSAIKPEKLATALGIMTGALASVGGMLIGFSKAIQALKVNPATLIATSAAILIFAAALIVLAGALALFTLVSNMEGTANALSTMAISILLAGGSLALLAKLVNPVALLAAAVAMGVMAASLLVLAVALEAFTLIAKQDAAADGLLRLVGALAVVTAALVVLGAVGPSVLAAAAAIAIVSASLLLMAAALEAFILISKQGFECIAGLVVLAATLGIVVAALMVLGALGPTILAGAGALALAAVAVVALAAGLAVAAVAITALGLGIEAVIAGFGVSVGTAIGAIGLGIGVALAAVAAGITAVIASIGAGIALGIAAIGQGIASANEAIGASIHFLGEGIGVAIQAVSAAIAAGAVTIGAGIDALAAMIGVAFDGLSVSIQGGLEKISLGVDAISASLSGVGDSITAIGTGIENFGRSIGTLASIPLISIGTGLVEVAKGVKELNKNKFTGDASNIASYAQALSNLSQVAGQIATLGVSLKAAMLNLGNEMSMNLANGIQNSMGMVSAAGITMVNNLTVSLNNAAMSASNAGINIANNFVRGIMAGQGSAYNAGDNLGANAYNGANAPTGWFNTIGYNMSIGMANGLWSGAASVYSAAYTIATTATNIVSNALSVRSPSRVFMRIGEYMALGMAIGIESETRSVVKSTEEMAGMAIDTASNAMTRIAEALTADLETNPTITPVLDLSNVEEGSRQITDFLSANKYALGAVGDISYGYGAMQQAEVDKASQGLVATIDPTSLASMSDVNNERPVNVNMTFNGSLAQLAAVLQPAIVVEGNRLGESLINA